ncbi:hypothetical protein V8E36_007662 [Tilletia maclaganii]
MLRLFSRQARAQRARWHHSPAVEPRHLLFHTFSSQTPAPYLNLRSRLLLAIISPTFLSLLVLLCVTAIPLLTPGASPIQTRIDQAKDRLTSACAGVQAAAGAIQGVPTYMARGVNSMVANSIEYTVSSLGHLLMLLIYATEKVLIYIVDTYRSLLQCLIELLIRGVLAVLTQAVSILSDGINAASQGIKSAVEAAVSGVNTAISSSLTGVNDVLHLIGKSVDVPQIGVPDLSALDNVRLPSFFMDGLIALNNTIPTLDAVKDRMNVIIASPLESLRTDVNNTINDFTFDRSTLTVPPLPSTAIQVCNSTTLATATGPLDELSHAVHKLEIILLAALLFAILLVALATVGLEWWAWRAMWRHVRLVREICGTAPASDAEREGDLDSTAGLRRGDSMSKMEEAGYGTGRSTADPYATMTSGTGPQWNQPVCEDDPYGSTERLQKSPKHQHVPLAPVRRATRGSPSHSHSASPERSETPRFVVMSDHRVELPPSRDAAGLAQYGASPSPPLNPLASDRGTLDLVHLVHHPLATSLSLRLASFFRVRRALTLDALRWYFGGWLGHAGMLALLAFSILGAASTEIHILALERLATQYDHKLSGALNDFTGGIRNELQASFLGQSVTYAQQVNNQINTYEARINKDVFGWVDVTTTTMNNTLNDFVDIVEDAISNVFNNTILYSPVQTFLNCILIRKIEGIESALTWVHDNANVHLARVDPNILTLDNNGMDDLLRPVTQLGSAVSGQDQSSDDGGGGQPTVRRIVDGQIRSLENQRDFFLILLGGWVLLALGGLAWMFGRMRAGTRNGSHRALDHAPPSPPKEEYIELAEHTKRG